MKEAYQLLTEREDGTWTALDLGTDRPAWTCQANDLADLSDRNTSYSQSLKLPKTPRNIEAFGHANIFDAQSRAPYRRHPCRLYCAGRAVAGAGAYLILLKSAEYFECQILSGNAGFFDRLQEAPMSELDLGVFQICNRSLDPATWHPAYKIAYGSDIVIPSYPRQPAEGVSEVAYSGSTGAKYPAVSVDCILQQIMERHGYAFESNIHAWEKMYLSISSADVTPSAEDLRVFDMEIHTTGHLTLEPSQGLLYRQYRWGADVRADGMLIEAPPLNDRISHIVPAGAKIKYTMTKTDPSVVATPLADYMTTIVFERDGESMLTGYLSFDGQPAEVVREYENDSLMTHRLVITAYCTEEPLANMGITVRAEVVQGWTPNMGGKLILSERLGFETQFAFVKFLAQAFGLTVYVDEAGKIVHAYTMQRLYDRIAAGEAADWSGKATRDTGASTGFTLSSYARENVIAYEKNEKDGLTDSAAFHIDNETLAATKELFKLGIEAGKDLTVYGYPVLAGGARETAASIPLVELKQPLGGEEEDPSHNIARYLPNATYPTIKPHLLTLTDRTVKVWATSAAVVATYDYPVANHVPARQLVDVGYAILQERMLRHARVVEEAFLLTPEDVERFDPSVPVYVGKYGAYFYVNRIKNFEAGKLTACELIRL